MPAKSLVRCKRARDYVAYLLRMLVSMATRCVLSRRRRAPISAVTT